MEQTRKSGSKPSHMWSNNFSTRLSRQPNGEGQSFQHMVLGKLASTCKKNEDPYLITD